MALIATDYLIQIIFGVYGEYLLIDFLSLLFGVVLFCAIPTKLLKCLKDKLYAFRERQLVRQTINRSRQALSSKLYDISGVFIEMSNAFNAFKNAFSLGKNSDELFSVFKNSLDNELKSCEILYDYIWGDDTLGIDGKTQNYIPKIGDTVIMDISIKHGGVWCDVTRTFFVGEPSKSQAQVFDMLKCAMKSGENAIKIGAKACDIYNAVNSVYLKNGCELVHHAGHKILTEAVMQPQFLPEKDGVIESGAFYTLEPGFYKDFGIRLENDYLLTDSGLENLFEGLMPLDIKEYILK